MSRQYCNGKGHPGGAKTYRVCRGCGERKANTAFRSVGRRTERGRGPAPLASKCIKCEGGFRRDDSGRNYDCTHLHVSRVPFDAWMAEIGASKADYELVARAVRRYGKKSPAPDCLIEEYLRDHNLPRQRYGALFHATVLLAHETKNGGRMATYNLSPSQAKRHRHTRAA